MRDADDFRAEVEDMGDGRRIIYYSWPDEEPAPTSSAATTEASATPAPASEPWSPETQPDAPARDGSS